jgi:hypothetical protein
VLGSEIWGWSYERALRDNDVDADLLPKSP